MIGFIFTVGSVVVWAAVLPLVGWSVWPVGLAISLAAAAFSVAGLFRTTKLNLRGRWLAWTGFSAAVILPTVAVAAVWTVGLLAAVSAFNSGDFDLSTIRLAGPA